MLVIDRFEGEWAVIEDGHRTFNLPRLLLPDGSGEGDEIGIKVVIIKIAAGGKQDLQQLMNDIFNE